MLVIVPLVLHCYNTRQSRSISRIHSMVRDTQPTSHPSPYFGLPAALPLPDGPEQDPLATWTLPPTNESPAEYLARQKAEVEAKKRSELIDEGIRLDKAVLRKERKALVKVLLVGQSESGKSTTLKSELCSSRIR